MERQAGGQGRDGAREPRAVALRYDRSVHGPGAGDAPRVVARGRGLLAERILEAARRHGVPVREDPDLVQLLGACELGEEIPQELYAAVAQLLAWLYRVHLAEAGPAAGSAQPGQHPPHPA